MFQRDPQLYFGEDGAPRSARFGDIYYSLDGGLDESQAVFLQGCALPQAWSEKANFCVLELGFGTGLNILALIDLWLKHRPLDGQLRVFSIEAFLMTRDQAKAALDHFPQLAELSNELLRKWPHARYGLDYIEFPQWGVTLTLAQMDVTKGLLAFGHKADAVFLDGFSPRLNPEMWSASVMEMIADRCCPQARLATFTVAKAVRDALSLAGFEVKKCTGFGKKRERLEAIFKGNTIEAERHIKPNKIAIIGAGIAGACLYRQAQRIGLEVTLFEAQTPASGASGNRAGLVAPRLDSGDNKAVRLIADAYAYALNFYSEQCSDAVHGRGVYQIAREARDMARFSKITQIPNYAEDSFEIYEKGQCHEVSDGEGIILKTALWMKPTEIIATLLEGAQVISAEIVNITEAGIRTRDGDILTGFDTVVLANGEGIFDFVQAPFLRPVHGQVEHIATQAAPKSALSWGGYCVPDGGGLVFGATHDRDVRGNKISAEDASRNLSLLAEVLPELAAQVDASSLISRASTRVMSLDLMPVIGELAPQVWVLTGLGSRGFCTAPLMAKWLLQLIVGQGIDAHEDVMKSVSISRFKNRSFI